MQTIQEQRKILSDLRLMRADILLLKLDLGVKIRELQNGMSSVAGSTVSSAAGSSSLMS